MSQHEGQLATVSFHGVDLIARIDGTTDEAIWVPVAPICRHLGLNLSGQLQRIHRDPTFAGRYVYMHTPSAGGSQETLAIRLDMLNLWLAGISVAKVNPEHRDRLLLYRRECAHVLYEHFFLSPRGRSIQVETLPPLVLQRVEAKMDQLLINTAPIPKMAHETRLLPQISVDVSRTQQQVSNIGQRYTASQAVWNTVAEHIAAHGDELRTVSEKLDDVPRRTVRAQVHDREERKRDVEAHRWPARKPSWTWRQIHDATAMVTEDLWPPRLR